MNTEVVAKTIINISTELLLYLGKDNGWSQNTVFSSLSLHHLLTLLQLGSKGKTYKALCNVTGIGNDTLLIKEDPQDELVKDIPSESNVDYEKDCLNVNNGVFSGCKLQEDYITHVTRVYHVIIKQVNFHDVKASVSIIDQWISESTNNMINDMMKKANCITKDTSLVLVNTAFFKAKWLKPFKKEKTTIGEFHVNTNSTVDVEYMKQKNKFKYFKDTKSNITAIKLLFKNPHYSAIVILPPLLESYSDIFQPTLISKTLDQLENSVYESVMLTLPKFSFQCDVSLKKFLSGADNNGGKDLSIIFDPRQCDFDGISEEKIVVSEILQSAKIIVDEEETVAAVATAAILCGCSMPREPLILDVNRPFLYLIWDDENMSPVFTAFLRHPKNT